ncbi:MAG: ECF transporter S component [Clostridiales bacterium]|nr:ECF transporter S component [Clostridiales bacterium]
METKSNTFKIVLTALMMCLIMVSILFIRIPIPFTQGYVHMGDAMIFLSVLILGWKYGALAAALGGALGDLIGGFAMWAPWTFGIKGIMAIIMGVVIMAVSKNENLSKGKFLFGEIVGIIISGVFMTAAYYAAEGIMYGNWIVPLMGIPWNIGQFVVGMVIATVIATALCKTPAKSYFTYRLKTQMQS